MQQRPDRQKGRREAARPSNCLQKQNHPSPSGKSFPEQKGTETNGRQKKLEAENIFTIWLFEHGNGLMMVDELYLTQINSLHLASTDVKVKQW